MTPPLLLFLLLLSSVPSVLAADDWSTLSSERAIAFRSQRDVSANITIDQQSLVGASLASTVFTDKGYTLDALEDVRDLLNYGFQMLEVDIYWHEQLHKFQLCPEPLNSSLSSNATQTFNRTDGTTFICRNSLGMSNLAQTILSYLTDSDTNLNANLLVLVFNMFSISQSKNVDISSDAIGTYNDTLSSVLENYFSAKLYTPSSLQADQTDSNAFNALGVSTSGWPKLTNFLFSEKKRVLAAVWENRLLSNTTYVKSSDVNTVFNATFLDNLVTSDNLTSISNYTSRALESWRFAFDNPDIDNFTNSSISNAVSLGYSPVLNTTISTLSVDIPTLLNDSLWSWESAQPRTESDARRVAAESGVSSTQSAFNCAALSASKAKWEVSNCYAEKPVACRMKTTNNSFEWAITVDKFSYFHASEGCDGLPDSTYVSAASSMSNNSAYEFSVPKSALEQHALSSLLSSADLNATDIWIDMNSIAISNCWVTGGPYASCPYQKVSSHRNFVEMLTPAAVFCGVIFFGILLLRLRKVPVWDNRKYWKKLVNEYSDNEYEGVPS